MQVAIPLGDDSRLNGKTQIYGAGTLHSVLRKLFENRGTTAVEDTRPTPRHVTPRELERNGFRGEEAADGPPQFKKSAQSAIRGLSPIGKCPAHLASCTRESKTS